MNDIEAETEPTQEQTDDGKAEQVKRAGEALKAFSGKFALSVRLQDILDRVNVT